MSDSIIPSNRLKKLLTEGKCAVGTMVVEFRQPSVTQMLSNAGFDFIIIDNEHGAFNIETIADLSRAARLVNVTPIVRVPESTYTYISQSLDAGAQGIMIPRISNAREVEDVVQIVKYAPVGRRGCVVARGHTDFKSGPLIETFQRANEESLLVVQIETAEALKNIEAIISVRGVDVALIGPTDLSMALGIPGEMDNPRLHNAINRMIEVAGRAGVYPAIHMNVLAQGEFWAERGMRMVSHNSEVGLLTRAGTEATTALNEAFRRRESK